MNLRPYQSDAISLLREKFASSKRIILCLPTGAGKTVSFATLAKAVTDKDPKARVLILTDRIELLSQAGGTLSRIGINAGILSAQSKYMPSERVVIGMVETYHRRYQKGWRINNLKLVIVDEAHKGNFRKVIEGLGDVFVIGATATPVSSSKKNPLKSYFYDIVSNIDIPELIEKGYLASPKYFSVPFTVTAKIKKSTGDYDEKQLFEQYDKPELYDGCVKNYQKHADGKKTLIFCVNIEHTRKTAESFLLAGFETKFLTSEMDSVERKRILSWYAKTPNGVLVNCGILTTGFDQPDVECVILNRSTTSLPLYLQMVGRGSRVTEIKKEFTIIDMGDNIKRLSFWDDYRDWHDEFHNPGKPKKEQVAPVKSCPECEALLAVRLMKCPHCGYAFEKTTESEPPPVADTVQVFSNPILKKRDSQLSLDELIIKCSLMKKADGKPYKKMWVAHKLLDRPNAITLLTQFAVINKYKSPSYWAETFYKNHSKSL